MEAWTFFWLNGDKDTYSANSPEEALNNNGIGKGALRALDFWCKGLGENYYWKDNKWYNKDFEIEHHKDS